MYVLDQKQENKVYPLKPQFFYIKVGFEGVYIARTCFPDDFNISFFFSSINRVIHNIIFHGKLTCLLSLFIYDSDTSAKLSTVNT